MQSDDCTFYSVNYIPYSRQDILAAVSPGLRNPATCPLPHIILALQTSLHFLFLFCYPKSIQQRNSAEKAAELSVVLSLSHQAEMRDEEAQRPQTTPSSSSSTSSAASFSVKRDGSGLEGLFGRGRCKLWALAAILLLALWSMFAGSVTLKWSAANLKHSLDDLDSSIQGDLDVLDVDEREKMVRQMWNVYKHSSIVRLPSFWRDAFGAAYQDLTSEVASVRNAALLEIAKMSFQSTDAYEPPPVESTARVSAEARPRMQAGKIRKQQ